MRDPDRLRQAGSAEERALLSAPPPLPPPALREEVRRAVEAAALRPRPRARLLIAAVATLLGGAGLAFALRGRPAPPPPMPAPVPVPAGRALPAPAPPRPQPAPPRSARPARARIAHRLGEPGLAAPPTGWREPETRAAPPAPATLVISREGRREIRLELVGNRVRGKVRDAPVALELAGKRLLGKLGDEPVELLLVQDHEARGSIANHAVGFQLSDAPGGHLARGSVPAHTTRVELTERTLSWYPGCGEPLALVAPGTYAGTCAGRPARVVLPAEWRALPPLARLILLSLFLPERDPGLPDRPPALFGPPDWP